MNTEFEWSDAMAIEFAKWSALNGSDVSAFKLHKYVKDWRIGYSWVVLNEEEILQVERLSDLTLFAVGEKIIYRDEKRRCFIIESFKVDEHGILWACGTKDGNKISEIVNSGLVKCNKVGRKRRETVRKIIEGSLPKEFMDRGKGVSLAELLDSKF